MVIGAESRWVQKSDFIAVGPANLAGLADWLKPGLGMAFLGKQQSTELTSFSGVQPPKIRSIKFYRGRALGHKKSHRKIAVTTVAASGLATIPLQKSHGFSLHRPANQPCVRIRLKK